MSSFWFSPFIGLSYISVRSSTWEISNSFSSLQVIIVEPEAYTYDDEVLKKAEAMGKPGLVEIHAKEDSFIFTVETTGAVKASQLVLNAIEVLKQKLDAVRLSDDTVEADDQFGELGAHMRGGWNLIGWSELLLWLKIAETVHV